MVHEDGMPRVIDMATVRRKLRSIAKQKAPGLTSNGPDQYAAQPGSWVEWAVVLFNAIQHTQVAPRGWHVELVHYVHKGGTDSSLSNHRPLALIEVLRKVFTGIVVDRMRHDWSRLKVLDECNPGFQAGRTTAKRHPTCSHCCRVLLRNEDRDGGAARRSQVVLRHAS